MRILIVGSEGFIGKALYNHYKSENVQVFGADISPRSHPDYFCVDATSPDYKEIFRNYSFDCCINASGAANVNFSVSNPELDYNLNTSNVFKLLDSIRMFNSSCRFLQISSAALYGNPSILPVNENFPIQPLSPYGFHKWQSELLCKEFNEIYGIQTKIVRIFSAYGPGLRKQLFWDLYQKSLLSKEIEIHGTGTESRDFVYIDDIVLALSTLINSDFKASPVINIASGIEITMKEAVDRFFDFMGLDVKLGFNGIQRVGDPLNWRADISTLQKIGYTPSWSFSNGLNQYCTWLKSVKNIG